MQVILDLNIEVSLFCTIHIMRSHIHGCHALSYTEQISKALLDFFKKIMYFTLIGNMHNLLVLSQQCLQRKSRHMKKHTNAYITSSEGGAVF